MTEKNVLFLVNKPRKFLFLVFNHTISPMLCITHAG